MIRNLLIIAAAAFAAVSCLKGTAYESNYTAVVDFEGFSDEWDQRYHEGEFYGDDDAFFEGTFYVDVFEFNCEYDKSLNDYSGFALSKAAPGDSRYEGRFSYNYADDTENEDQGEDVTPEDGQTAETEAGDDGDSQGPDIDPYNRIFAVFHKAPGIDASRHVSFTMTEDGTCTPVSCLVNNTRLVAGKIAEYNASHPETPIEMTLIATGYAGGKETGSADILLAGRVEQKDSIVSTWTAFDLQKLGNVEYIDFNIDFSDKEQNVIPEYFCLDRLVSKVHILIPAE